MFAIVLCAGALVSPIPEGHAAQWAIVEKANTGGPGKQVEIKLDGQLVAAFIHGEGQFKPYLHVYGAAGERLTNGGLDADGKPVGKFPHHRGIYIGWNKIKSDLGEFDLWHFNNGGQMTVKKFEKLEAWKDSAVIVAQIEWRGGKKDAQDSDLLLTETRTLTLSRPAGNRTQVDAQFVLKAARDLSLDGDLQHAGIHFRAADEVANRAQETSYLWEPDLPAGAGKVVSPDFKWCRLRFPMGERWYTSLELNAPGNPVEELSWRDYGRFGFFFKKSLKTEETLKVNYRFLIERVEKPGTSAEETAKARADCAAQYEAFVKSVK